MATNLDAQHSARRIAFDGVRNFRDLGGFSFAHGALRKGVVFRSDRLSKLTGRDTALLRELGVTTIIDMRAAEERERAPNRIAAASGITQITRPFLPRHTLPMFDAINSGCFDAAAAHGAMLKQYEALAIEHVDTYAQLVDDLLVPGRTPLVLHCTSGKDRTGMIAAILLLALGVPMSDIITDYVMTQDHIEKVDYFEEHADPASVQVVMSAKAEFIEAAFAAMTARYGTVERYLSQAIRINTDKRQGLEALLLCR